LAGGSIVVIVTSKWLVGAGSRCQCCRLVGLSGGSNVAINNGICIAVIVIVIVGCCVLLVVQLELCSTIPFQARKVEKKTFQLAVQLSISRQMAARLTGWHQSWWLVLGLAVCIELAMPFSTLTSVLWRLSIKEEVFGLHPIQTSAT